MFSIVYRCPFDEQLDTARGAARHIGQRPRRHVVRVPTCHHHCLRCQDALHGLHDPQATFPLLPDAQHLRQLKYALLF